MTDDRYVHEPDDEGNESTTVRKFDWRGWLLVAAIITCFVVIPVIIAVRPPQLPYFFTLIALPLLPAILLGLIAVWAATR